MSYSGWKIADVQYLHHKAITSIALEREDGKRLYVNVSDEAFEKHHTAYFPSDSQAKENPQTDVESVVGAGTDFLMKVTEEAVITGMLLVSNEVSKLRDTRTRDKYRKSAEDITLEEVKRYVEFDQQDDSPFTFRPREEDPEPETDDTVIRAAHGIPAPRGFEKVGPPRILPADRYAPGMKVDEMTGDEFLAYLDATQGK